MKIFHDPTHLQMTTGQSRRKEGLKTSAMPKQEDRQYNPLSLVRRKDNLGYAINGLMQYH